MPRKWGGHGHQPCLPGVARSRPPAPQYFPKPPLPRPGVREGTVRPCALRSFGEGGRGMPRKWGGHGHYPCLPGLARNRSPALQQFPKPPLPRPGVGEGTAYPDAGGASGGDCHGCGGTWEAHGSFLVWRKSSAVHVTPPRASGDSVSSGEGISDAEDGRRDADGGKGGSRARRGWVEMTRRRWWLLVAVAA